MCIIAFIKRLSKRKKKKAVNPYLCTTIKGESVKSYGEKEIADFLYSNNVRYRYEEPYKYEPNYRPDFHIIGTKIWIEYFGIDRDGNVPDWFQGKNPSKEYRKQMKWKKKIHRKNHTVLISLYAYQRSEGTLLRVLSEELRKNGIKTNTVL